MKNLTFKLASAALGLSLCLGASASPSIPLAMAPAAQANNHANPDYIIIWGPHYVVVTDIPVLKQLQQVNQAAQFDRTN